MWIVKRTGGADTFFTGKDRSPWSSEMKDACVYETQEDTQEAMEQTDWPLGDIEVVELPDFGRYSNVTKRVG